MTPRARRAGRRRILVAALLAAAACLGLAPAIPGIGPQAGPAAAATGMPVEVTIESMTTGAATAATGLAVTGRIRNTGPTALQQVVVALRSDSSVLDSLAEVTEWVRQRPTAGAGRNLPGTRVRLAGPLAPDGTYAFSIHVPGAVLAQALPGGFGPRGLAVVVTALLEGEEQRAGIQRTFTIWQPEGHTPPQAVEVGLAAPLDAGAAETDLSTPSARFSAQFAAGGRLTRLLDATSGPEVTWLVDGAVVEAARAVASGASGPTPQTSASPAPSPAATTDPAATRWLDGFAGGIEAAGVAGGRKALALPWGDPDLAALAHATRAGPDEAARVRSLFAGAQARTRRALEALVAEPVGLAWPAEGLADTATAAFAAGGSLRRLLVSDDVPGPGTVSTPAGPLSLLRANPTASAALAGMGSGQADASLVTLLAQAAALAMERGASPDGAGALLAVAPRGWDVEPEGLRTALDALAATPWVRLGNLAEAPAVIAATANLTYPRSAAAREVPPEHVNSAAASLARARAFSPAVDAAVDLQDPPDQGGATGVADPFEARALSIVSTTWRRAEPTDLARSRTRLALDVRAMYASVSVVPGSQILLLATSAQIPVRVSNDLARPVQVQVALRPRSGQILANETVLVDVRAGSDATARVPVRTIANGDVEVEATLSVPNGGPVLGPPVVLELRVRRDWESRGLAVGAGVLALLVVVGLLRSMRKDRVRLRPEDTPDFDVLAAAEEERRDRAGAPAQPRPSPEEPAEGALEVDVARSSAVMAVGTALSRILGFVRTAMLGAAIGVKSASADAFGVANTVPNIIYMLLAGSVLNAVLVPQITRAARQGAAGRLYVDRLVTLSMTVIAGVTVVVTLGAPILVSLYTSGTVSPDQLALATAFAYWCLPQVLFYGLYMVWGQILNARGHFGAFTWAPVVNNVVAIVGLAVFIAVEGAGGKDAQGWTAWSVALLAGSATLGVAAQALILLPVLRRSGYRWRPRWGLRGAGLRTASTVAAWTFAAVVATQLSFVVTSRVLTAAGELSRAEPGDIAAGLAIYSFAFLLFMLPHSIITVSLVTALFTRMSDAAGRGDTPSVREDLSLGLRLTLLVTIPSSAFMIFMGTRVAAVIFPANTPAETRGIGLGAAAMMLGLAAFSATYLLQRVFYSYEDARTPFLAQLPSVALTVAGTLAVAAFVPPDWAVVGVGLVMTAASTLGLTTAALLLRRRLSSLDSRRVLRVAVRVTIAAAVAAAGSWGAALSVEAVCAALDVHGMIVEVAAVAAAVLVMAGLYYAGLRATRVRELDELTTAVLKRRRRH